MIGSLAATAQPASADVANLKINEVESNGGTPGDWVEVLNTGATPVDVSGFRFRDNDFTHAQYAIPAGTTLAPGAYYMLEEAAFGFGLGAADSATLWQPDGATVVDEYSWTAHAATTYGRCPNGTGAFVATASSTKAAANDCPAPLFKINEVESNGGTPGDWVEIVNAGTASGDLGGFRFRDNDPTHAQYAIPAGTTLAPGAYYLLEEAAFGFGLGAADSATLWQPDGTTVVDTYAWTAHAATTDGRCPNGSGAFTTTTSSTKAAANDCAAAPVANVKLNEVESSGGSPGDWVELRNNGTTTADVGGYRFIDNDPTHTPYAIPTGTTLAPGAHYVLEEAAFGFGLGAADSATLLAPDGTTVDTHAWTAHAATTFGRCPDGTGSFVTTQSPTKGAANLCAGDIPASPWPGGAAVAFADDAGVFGGNISGLAYQASGTDAPGVLWVVKNGPGTMYRLLWDGTKWTPDTANGWGAGKILRFTDGLGDPDAEGVTLVGGDPANGVYVSTERNNAASAVSRPAVLKFDVSQPGTTLTAMADWNLTSDLPGLGPNLGLEAVEWIPDAFLVSKGFTDEAANAPYDPATYPGHGTGLFFVGVEQDGVVYAYALDQTTSAFTRVATIATGFPGVMELEFEPETSHLWAVCDDTCQGRSATLDIVQGKFVVTNVYERPAGMPNLNNEGFAIAPQDECVDGHKPVFWTDDANTDSHAIRGGTINCTVIVRDQTITFAQPPAMTFGGPAVPLVATASSGLPVSFIAAGPCAITGSATLTATGAGTCTVTASQPGSARYRPADPVTRTVTIAKAATVLDQTPVSFIASLLTRRVTYNAVLKSRVTGLPLAGKRVTFSAAPPLTVFPVCSALTDATGRATCTGPLPAIIGVVLTGGTTARFAGDTNYEVSTNTRPLRL